MRASNIRVIIKEAIEEMFQGSKNTYPTSNANSFPYFLDSEAAKLPQEISPKSDYLQDFSDYSTNNDTYEFPQKEFNLGIEIEKKRNPNFNIIEIAQKVLRNMKEDYNFYSKL